MPALRGVVLRAGMDCRGPRKAGLRL